MSAHARKQRAITSDRVDPTKPAAIVINDRFKGLSHFCDLTGYPSSTVWGWLARGFIPPLWKSKSTHPHILQIAANHAIKMTPADFVEKPANDQNSSPATPTPAEGESAAATVPSGLPPLAAAALPTDVDA